MIKFTDEQVEKLRSHLNSAYGFNACLEPLFAEYHAILNESKTHRVVEAPEGYEFPINEPSSFSSANGSFTNAGFNVRRIPKSCPPPVLEPVTLTVSQRYPYGYVIPDGWMAQFETVNWLLANGFTHRLKNAGMKPATEVISLWKEHASSGAWVTMGLKKWEGE